jgi:hypothetical protein
MPKDEYVYRVWYYLRFLVSIGHSGTLLVEKVPKNRLPQAGTAGMTDHARCGA